MKVEVSSLDPVLQLVGLELADEGDHVHLDGCVLVPAVAAAEPLSIVDPPLNGKVGGLGHVEAMIEARMVGVREHNDHVTLLLDHFVHLGKHKSLHKQKVRFQKHYIGT